MIVDTMYINRLVVWFFIYYYFISEFLQVDNLPNLQTIKVEPKDPEEENQVKLIFINILTLINLNMVLEPRHLQFILFGSNVTVNIDSY